MASEGSHESVPRIADHIIGSGAGRTESALKL